MKSMLKLLSKIFYTIQFVTMILWFMIIVFPIWVIATHEERKRMKERD